MKQNNNIKRQEELKILKKMILHAKTKIQHSHFTKTDKGISIIIIIKGKYEKIAGKIILYCTCKTFQTTTRNTSKFLDLRPTTPKHEMFYHFKSHLSM